MARIAGVTIPGDKRVVVSLTYIYGIGRSLSEDILSAAGIDHGVRAKDLTFEQEGVLRSLVEKYQVEGDLRRKVQLDVKRLQDIGSYRGYRHRRRLPVRGQRTKTNARTKRGKKVTMGSGKKKEAKK